MHLVCTLLKILSRKMLRNIPRDFEPLFRGNKSIYLHRSSPLLENGLHRPENRYGRYGFSSFFQHFRIYRRGGWSQGFPLKSFFSCSLGGGGRYFFEPLFCGSEKESFQSSRQIFCKHFPAIYEEKSTDELLQAHTEQKFVWGLIRTWWTFRIFLIFFCWEGEGGVRGAGGGVVGWFFIEEIPGGGVSRRERGRGAGEGVCDELGNWGGGGLNIFSGAEMSKRMTKKGGWV